MELNIVPCLALNVSICSLLKRSIYIVVHENITRYLFLPLAGILPLDSPCSGLSDVIDIDEHYLGNTHTRCMLCT